MGLTDEPHLRAIAWNGVVLLATMLRIRGGLLPGELGDIPMLGYVAEREDKTFGSAKDDSLEGYCPVCRDAIENAKPLEAVPICPQCCK